MSFHYPPFYYPVYPPPNTYQYSYIYPHTSPFPYPYYSPYFYREYPPVNPNMFINSAKKMGPLLKDAEKLMSQLSTSTSFSQKIMAAAQEAKISEVQKMINGIGLKSKPEIKFNPSGLSFAFSNNENVPSCCQLLINIRWGM